VSLTAELEKYILTEIAADLGKQALDPAEDLLDQRVIDSLGILKLVSFLEKNYGIQVDDADVVPENFLSLNSIAAYVGKKRRNT
jgi:acyl carrier protein